MKKLLSLFCLMAMATWALAQTGPPQISPQENPVDTRLEHIPDLGSNEYGVMMEGLRDGPWITRSDNGHVIRMVNYRGGELHGSYALFFGDGKPKLMGAFLKGQPSGWWMYYNKRGRIIKQGGYADGRPTGVWEIYDKKGKDLIHLYDFGRQKHLSPIVTHRYFEKDVMMRSDMSDVMIYASSESVENKREIQPLGGMALSNDYMLQNFIIPKAFMDTRTELFFAVNIKVEDGMLRILDVDRLDAWEEGDLGWRYQVETELPKYVLHKTHNEDDIRFLAEQIKEYSQLMGPWLCDGFEGELTLLVPFILNGGVENVNLSMK